MQLGCIMLTASSSQNLPVSGMKRWNSDRVGVWASVLCAIHCAATPVLLILLPTFGKMWAHPATHWGMALIVVPIAGMMMAKGYQKHGRKWILFTGTFGIFFVLVGAILPYLETPIPIQEAAGSEKVSQNVAGTEGEEAAVG